MPAIFPSSVKSTRPAQWADDSVDGTALLIWSGESNVVYSEKQSYMLRYLFPDFHDLKSPGLILKCFSLFLTENFATLFCRGVCIIS